MAKANEFLTVDEAAAYALVKRRTIYNWLHQGLPSYKLGRRRIDPDDLDEFISKKKENILI